MKHLTVGEGSMHPMLVEGHRVKLTMAVNFPHHQ